MQITFITWYNTVWALKVRYVRAVGDTRQKSVRCRGRYGSLGRGSVRTGMDVGGGCLGSDLLSKYFKLY